MFRVTLGKNAVINVLECRFNIEIGPWILLVALQQHQQQMSLVYAPEMQIKFEMGGKSTRPAPVVTQLMALQ